MMRRNVGHPRRSGWRMAAGAFVATAGWLLAASPAAAQCVLCRESLKSGGSDELITGFMFSTLLLTAVPVSILSVFSYLIYRAAKRQAALESDEGTPKTSEEHG